MMFGLQDFGVTAAYALTVLSAAACVIYGIVNWNKPKEDLEAELREEKEWEARDPELTEGEAK